MEIDWGAAHNIKGFIERGVAVTETTAEGLGQSANIIVWIKYDDSRAVADGRIREEAIAFMERALASMKAAQNDPRPVATDDPDGPTEPETFDD